MKKILIIISLCATVLQASPLASPPRYEKEANLVINNRVLFKINGKAISVMDVVRKMDLIFYRQYPHLTSSAEARYQFYTSGWSVMLAALIDDHLIVADAAEKKVEVTEGEVRQELESLFGPDVVFNLDKIGLSLPEAMELLKMELLVQRMNMIMVRSRAMTDVHPKEVRARYDQLMQEQPPQSKWVYQILSIRGEEHSTVAQEASKLLTEQKIPFQDLIAKLSNDNVQVTLSEEYEREEGALSLAHKAVLQALGAGTYSTPLSGDAVSRIFCLKEYKTGELPTFNSMAEKLKQELMQEVSNKYNVAYREKLRTHYGMDEKYLKQVVPENFQPFALR